MSEDKNSDCQYFAQAEERNSKHYRRVVLQVAKLWRYASKAVVHRMAVDGPVFGRPVLRLHIFPCIVSATTIGPRVVTCHELIMTDPVERILVRVSLIFAHCSLWIARPENGILGLHRLGYHKHIAVALHEPVGKAVEAVFVREFLINKGLILLHRIDKGLR